MQWFHFHIYQSFDCFYQNSDIIPWLNIRNHAMGETPMGVISGPLPVFVTLFYFHVY